MLTQKQENFCINIIKGLSQREAWIKAGYSNKYAVEIIDTNAYRLAAKTEVKLRIHEIRESQKDNSLAGEQERKRILSEIARGKTSQFTDETGVIDKKKLDSHAIQGVEEQKTMGGKASVIKLKLHNPITAIAEMNKMEGSYAPEKHAIVGDILIEVVYIGRDKNKDTD